MKRYILTEVTIDPEVENIWIKILKDITLKSVKTKMNEIKSLIKDSFLDKDEKIKSLVIESIDLSIDPVRCDVYFRVITDNPGIKKGKTIKIKVNFLSSHSYPMELVSSKEL